jgi:hypothetical protein
VAFLLNERAIVKFIKQILFVAVSVVLFGCTSPKSFIDPAAPKYTYEDVKRKAQPIKLRLTVEFQRHGEPYPKVDPLLKDGAERTLRATGMIIPTDVDSVGEIKITVNNTGDRTASIAKGFGTGLTFGLIGSTVQDNYELTMSITTKGKTITKSGIKNSIYTTIGNASAPDGVQTSTISVAFSKVLEQMILQALKEMENSKELGLTKNSNPLFTNLSYLIKNHN